MRQCEIKDIKFSQVMTVADFLPKVPQTQSATRPGQKTMTMIMMMMRMMMMTMIMMVMLTMMVVICFHHPKDLRKGRQQGASKI